MSGPQAEGRNGWQREHHDQQWPGTPQAAAKQEWKDIAAQGRGDIDRDLLSEEKVQKGGNLICPVHVSSCVEVAATQAKGPALLVLWPWLPFCSSAWPREHSRTAEANLATAGVARSAAGAPRKPPLPCPAAA